MVYFAQGLDSKWFFLSFDFEKRLRPEHVCKVCARCALLLWFHKDSWCEAVLTPSGHIAPALFTFYKKLKYISSFWTPKSQYRWNCIQNCNMFYILGDIFAGVEIMTISSRIYLPKYSKTNLVTLAPFGPSGGGRLAASSSWLVWGVYFIV